MSNQDYAGFSHKDQAAKTKSYALRQHKDGETDLNVPAGKNVRFRINDADKMILDKNGNVGIGTTSPEAKLHINGDTQVEGSLKIN